MMKNGIKIQSTTSWNETLTQEWQGDEEYWKIKTAKRLETQFADWVEETHVDASVAAVKKLSKGKPGKSGGGTQVSLF